MDSKYWAGDSGLYKKTGGLNRNGPHRLLSLNAWHIGSGNLDVASLEEESHCGTAFEVSEGQIVAQCFFSCCLLIQM